MPRIVDYVIVTDAQFRLPADDGSINREFSFTLPDHTAADTRGALSYVVIPSSPDLTYTITLNGTVVFSKSALVDPQCRMVHDVLRGLRRGVNTLVVERTSSSGSMAFSGIVLSIPAARDSPALRVSPAGPRR